MKILHYFLGFPPYRSGGLTKYVFDLMCSQAEQGDVVTALWPGAMYPVGKKIRIKKRGVVRGVQSYELINPLPVPLDEGIRDVEAFTASCDLEIYREFLCRLKPAVIHIHTLMGLHREFLDIAFELGIRTIFTAHDFFGICPKVTLFRQDAVCVDDHGCSDCVMCNAHALSMTKIRLLQSPVYRLLKNNPIMMMLRKKHRRAFFEESASKKVSMGLQVDACAKQYQKLRNYYLDVFSKIDLIHFNSTVTEQVYRQYFLPKNTGLISITHTEIRDNRNSLSWEPGRKLRLTMLAPARPLKGFQLVQTALDGLWESGKRDFELKLFSPVTRPSPYMIIQENGYQYKELGEILQNTDVLLAPSMGYETFGFTALEALSYCVPVIVSNRMGVKDLLKDGGYVLEAGNVTQLQEIVKSLTPNVIKDMRENIKSNGEIKLWEQHVEEIYAIYRP